MMPAGRLACCVATATILAYSTLNASASEPVLVAVGQRGTWETAVPELGRRAGTFEKRGIKLDLLYTQGAGETLQAIISGSADIGVGVGIMGMLRAYGKGAPVRIVGSEIKGNPDYWYVAGRSPIRSLADAAGKTIAYTTSGSSSHNGALALNRQFGLGARPVAAGNLSSIFTQVMSGHIDIGIASPPFGLDALQEGKIRLLARGNDVEEIRGRTIRVVVVNAATAQKRKDLVERFARAYQDTVDWMFSDPTALRHFAEFSGISEELARRARDDFHSRDMMSLDEIHGLDEILRQAIDLRYLERPLTAEQRAGLSAARLRKE